MCCCLFLCIFQHFLKTAEYFFRNFSIYGLLKYCWNFEILTPVGFFLANFFWFFYVPLFNENGLTFSHQILQKYSWYYSGGHYTKKSRHGPLCWESFWDNLRLMCFPIFFDNHSIFLVLYITVMVISRKMFFHAI